jgi:hypothetical protein
MFLNLFLDVLLIIIQIDNVMAKNPILVSVEVTPYLAQYLIHYYGEHPIKAHTKSQIYPFISGYIQSSPAHYRPLKPSKGLVTFELPYNRIYDIRNKNYIPSRHFSAIKTYFRNIFLHHFIHHMDQHCLIGYMHYKTAIINFMEENEISYDYFQYDSLKRIYLRHRKKCLK